MCVAINATKSVLLRSAVIVDCFTQPTSLVLGKLKLGPERARQSAANKSDRCQGGRGDAQLTHAEMRKRYRCAGSPGEY
jgi:hypothetical protein